MIEQFFNEERQYGEPVFSQTAAQTASLRAALKDRLDAEGQTMLSQLEDQYIHQSSAMIKDAYADGFSAAVKLLAEAMQR